MTDTPAKVDAGLTDPLWITIADAAARQVPSVSRQAMHKRVGKLVDAGRLSTRPGPRGTVLVNVVALSRAIAAETDPAQALRNGRVPAEIEDDEPELAELQDEAPASTTGNPSYHASRATREAYQAENARLDLEERLQLLTYVDAVDRRTMAATRKIRDRFLALPAMVADRVMSAPDVRTVRALLTTEVRAILALLESELMKMDEDDAAGDEFDDEPVDREQEAVAA